MSENASETPVSPQREPEAAQSGLRGLVFVCYGLFLLALFNGLTAVVGLIIAYVKKRDAAGTVWRSHFDNLILVFWVIFAFFAVMLVSLPAAFVSLALWVRGDFVWPAFSSFAFPALMWLVVGPILLIWFLYRMIRGLIRASEDSAY